MQTIYKIQIEYPSEKDKLELERWLDEELNKLLKRLEPLNIKTKLNKDNYTESN